MADVAITGAAGNVGEETRAALADDHDLTLVTHRAYDDLDSTVLEIDDREAVADALAGQDVVVHLAANPSPDAAWDDVLGPNVDGTYAVYEAAVSGGVDRVVFASTNHVDQYYNVADPARPETMREDAVTVRPDDPVRPDSYYGVSKVAGEAMGSYYAGRHGIEVVNLRIGWLLTRAELADLQEEDEAAARYARVMWLSPRDCRDVVRRAVESDLPESPLTVNAVSRNTERYLSLTETMRSIGYEPRDDSAEALAGD
ncbi:MAG: NAD-dependent epimerase/dehydratase family protein [Halobacteriaceae archaeon]